MLNNLTICIYIAELFWQLYTLVIISYNLRPTWFLYAEKEKRGQLFIYHLCDFGNCSADTGMPLAK